MSDARIHVAGLFTLAIALSAGVGLAQNPQPSPQPGPAPSPRPGGGAGTCSFVGAPTEDSFPLAPVALLAGVIAVSAVRRRSAAKRPG